MSNTEQPDHTDDNRLAFAAVSLCGNTPKGNAPQWHELAAWREGNLPDARAREVLSHIANDPTCFQQWLDIAEAETWSQEEALTDIDVPEDVPEIESTIASNVSDKDAMSSPAADRNRTITDTPSLTSKVIDSLRSVFQQPLPVYGGAFAAVMLAVLLVPMLQTGDGLSLQQQLDRSMDTYIESSQGYLGNPPPARNTRALSGLFDDLSTSDVERLQFKFGMHQFNQQLQQLPAAQVSTSDSWRAWLAALPEEPVDCDTATDAEHCSTVAMDFQQLGQWSLMNAAACQTSSVQGQAASDEDYWSAQYALYDQMRALPSVNRSQIFSSLLPELQQTDAGSLCAIVTSIVAAVQ
ncbi:hypothetical protein N9383_00900 [Granulosicoccus sp.]|nr:hypothetical protein [Granulosicoccus sp.]